MICWTLHFARASALSFPPKSSFSGNQHKVSLLRVPSLFSTLVQLSTSVEIPLVVLQKYSWAQILVCTLFCILFPNTLSPIFSSSSLDPLMYKTLRSFADRWSRRNLKANNFSDWLPGYVTLISAQLIACDYFNRYSIEIPHTFSPSNSVFHYFVLFSILPVITQEFLCLIYCLHLPLTWNFYI